MALIATRSLVPYFLTGMAFYNQLKFKCFNQSRYIMLTEMKLIIKRTAVKYMLHRVLSFWLLSSFSLLNV